VRLFAALLVLLISARTLAAESPTDPDAKLLYDEGMARYAARDYRAAIRAFEAAYAVEPRREFLFADAQATRLAGDCPAALALYQRFLDTHPAAPQVEATRIAVARCEAAASATVAPSAPPVVVAPAPPPPPRWYADRKGGLLVGAGLVGLGAGAALLSSAHAADSDDRGASTYDAFSTGRRSAVRRWGWGLGVGITGAALLAVGVGRYLWVAAHPDGAAVGAGARF
jgi:tetratricopeptide (TPR) repeat protein